MTSPRNAQATGLMLELQDSWSDMTNLRSKNLQLNGTKNVPEETNTFGDATTGGTKYTVSGEGADDLRAMQKSYEEKSNSMFDEKFAAYATKSLGKDFNSLSSEEQSKFKVDNMGAASVIRYGVMQQMGASPLQQVLNQIGQMIQQGGVKEEKKKDRQPMIGPR